MTRITTNIPVGVSGDFEVATYTPDTNENNWKVYLAMKNESHATYNVLLKNSCPMPIMQDSEAEYNEHQWLWDNATGDVLIGGLGLGLVHQPLLNNPDISSVTIIESEQDVIDLVWNDCVKDSRFEIIKADFETWTPPPSTTYDVIWCDSWIADNLSTIQEYKTELTEKYSPHTNKLGFWGSL
jgi:hypothetical protein